MTILGFGGVGSQELVLLLLIVLLHIWPAIWVLRDGKRRESGRWSRLLWSLTTLLLSLVGLAAYAYFGRQPRSS